VRKEHRQKSTNIAVLVQREEHHAGDAHLQRQRHKKECTERALFECTIADRPMQPIGGAAPGTQEKRLSEIETAASEKKKTNSGTIE
jgi:hypothetical protein